MRKKRSFREAMNQDKILWITVFILAIFFIPSTFAHEVGHILICMNNGFSYEITFESIFVNVNCSQPPQPLELYWSLGGIFGIFSCVWILIFRRFRTEKGVVIGVIVVAFDQFQKTIFETVTHTGYLSNIPLVFFTASLSLILMIILLWFFHYNPKKIT